MQNPFIKIEIIVLALSAGAVPHGPDGQRPCGVIQAETDPEASAELAKQRAYSSEATKKSRQKMYEEAATGNPEAVERYENYLAAKREAYHRKKQEAERTA